MKKTLLPFVTVVALLAMPVSQAIAAPKPTPPAGNSGGQMNMSASQMAAGQPMMSGWDMVKMRTTAKMRAKAARNAKLKGKPTMVAAGTSYVAGQGPDYFGTTPNYASSPMPKIRWTAGGSDVILPVYDPTNFTLTDPISNALIDPCSAQSPYLTVGIPARAGADTPRCGALAGGTMRPLIDPINKIPQLDLTKVSIAAGVNADGTVGAIRKFVEPLTGLGAPAAGTTISNSRGLAYLPVANPDTTTYPGSDYYEIGLKDYSQQFSPDLPASKLRGYYQINRGTVGATEHNPFYLGPIIMAHKDIPVRIKFVNNLPTGAGGNLFLPVDTSAMGAGVGPDEKTVYNQNRAVIHLHGGLTPWISDGTPHQWTTPVGDDTKYPKGVSVVSVPDMPAVSSPTDTGAANDGSLTFYYTNHQNARLMWYHDHAYGMTRLNVYAGEVSGYLLDDPDEKALVDKGTIPGGEGVPLIIQDKAFVPDDAKSGYFPDGQLTDQDPTWQDGVAAHNWGGTGSLWFPHVYMPNQNPYDNSGAAPMGRWDYGPWFWPIFGTAAGLVHGEVSNPYATAAAPWEPPMIPGTPSTYTNSLPKTITDANGDTVANPAYSASDASLVPEAFVDTPVVNGVAYPVMKVDPKAYRFRILNGANDRYWNLQMYCSAADKPSATGLYSPTNPAAVNYGKDMWDGAGKLQNPAAGEVPMVPAIQSDGFPADWPTDGRSGGVPDPAARAGNFLQIGTESGVLPNAVDVPNQPVNYVYNRRDIIVLSISTHALLLGPAERADVVYDFSTAANMGCKDVILYNDAPTPVPAFDPRNDYYTNNPDQMDGGGTPSTLPGYGPNTRTIMQFHINGVATGTSAGVTPLDTTALRTAVPELFAKTQHKPIVPETRYSAAYPNDPISASDVYSRIQSNDLTFNTTTSDVVSKVTLANPGSGYAPLVAVTRNPATNRGSGATASVTLVGDTVFKVNVVTPGSGYSRQRPPIVTISTPANGVVATARANVVNGAVTSYTVLTGGSGYKPAAATLTFDAPPADANGVVTGKTAEGTATVDLSTGTVSSVSLGGATNGGSGYTAAPGVTISAPLYLVGPTNPPVQGAQATASAALGTAGSVKTHMEPKAIQELFEMDFGRMNATLGVELQFTNAGNQTTLPLGFTNPETEFMSPSQAGYQIGTTRDGTQIWKITHNGVDTHTIHFHLMDVQLVNRVGWDGAIRPPDDNEMGWKESVRMNPLEDAIVAMRPATPELPFKIGVSFRSPDPTMPANHSVGTFDANGNPTTTTNAPVNMGWEYVWHCHLLGHEENDMMRPVDFQASPDEPTDVTAAATAASTTTDATGATSTVPAKVTISWKNGAFLRNANGVANKNIPDWQLANFVVERSTSPSFSKSVQTPSTGKPSLAGPPGSNSIQSWQGVPTTLGDEVAPDATSFVDSTVVAGQTYYYRVRAESADGYSVWSDAYVMDPTGSTKAVTVP
jgi:FtsP/CotA-like multicopper oxidase with cupredoxin domain